MDCRTFHRKLEDYLQDGLDFPARFGMERHAKQCYACEKDVTAALSLRQMARDLRRVGAPADFEASLLARIQTEKSGRRFWQLRELWLFGFEGFSWRVASVTALVTVLLVGTVTYLKFGTRLDRPTASQTMGRLTAPSPERKATQGTAAFDLPSAEGLGLFKPLASLGGASAVNIKKAGQISPDNWATPVAEPVDSGYIEFLVPFSGDRQLIMQLPRTIRMRYDQPSREYFIRNVSH
jgi:hypothetical protein